MVAITGDNRIRLGTGVPALDMAMFHSKELPAKNKGSALFLGQ
jgi:hypothetical protein